MNVRRHLLVESLHPRVVLASDFLDPSFGFRGTAVVAPNLSETTVVSSGTLDLGSDGKIVYGGGSSSSATMARFNVDGTLDGTFGVAGKISFELLGQVDAVEVLPDLSILATGKFFNPNNGGYDVGVVKFTPNGIIDTNFGNQGMTTIDFGYFFDEVAELVLGNGGAFYVVGTTGNGDFAAARFDSTGNLDPAFGTTGLRTIDVSPSDRARDGEVDSLGRLVIVGQTNNDIAVIRLTFSGVLDATFSGDGIAITDPSSGLDDAAYSVVIGAGDVIYAAGSAADESVVVKHNANGVLANAFGANGIAKFNLAPNSPGYDFIRDAALDVAGNLLVTASDSELNRGDRIVVASVATANGALNTGFGNGGIAKYSSFGFSYGFSHTTLFNNGELTIGIDFQFNTGLLQVTSNTGVPDSSFGNTGRVIVNFTDNAGSRESLSQMIVVPGGIAFSGGGAFGNGLIVRYESNGVLSPTFGAGGRAIVDAFEGFADIAALNTNAVYALGRLKTGQDAIVRLRNDGAVDTSFANAGYRALDSNFSGASLLLQSNGGLTIGGTYEVPGDDMDFAVIKLDPTGNLDPSFSGDGLQIVDFSGFDDELSEIELDNQQRIILAGNMKGNAAGPTNFGLARLTPSGVLDVNFSGGKVSTDLLGANKEDSLTSLEVLSDNSIIVSGGTAALGVSARDFALAKYGSNGVLSNAFDGDGVVILDFGGIGEEDLILDSDLDSLGRIIVSGVSDVLLPIGLKAKLSVSAFNATTGALDLTFNSASNGRAQPNISTYTSSIGEALVVDGSKVWLGSVVSNDFFGTNLGVIQLVASTGLPNPGFIVTRGFSVTDTSDLVNGLGLNNDAVKSIDVSTTGGTLVAGGGFGTAGFYAFLVRQQTNGLPDRTFAAGGIFTTPLFDYFSDAKFLSDGSILAVGERQDNLAVMKIKPNGEIDESYGDRGIVEVILPSLEFAKRIVVDSTGGAVVAGDVYDNNAFTYDFLIVKLDSTGNLDPSFSADGIQTVDINSQSSDTVEDMEIDLLNRIILVGTTTSADNKVAVVRLTGSGVLDTNFDGDGKRIVDIDPGVNFEYGEAVLVYPDNSLVVGAVTDSGGNDDFVLIRLSSQGALVGSFGTGGIANRELGGEDQISDLAFDSDGRLIAAGTSFIGGTGESRYAIVGLNATTGAVDSTFAPATGSVVLSKVFAFQRAFAVSLDTWNTKLVVAGFGLDNSFGFTARFGNFNPSLTFPSTPVSYTENSTPTKLFATATISDPDTVNFVNSQLIVHNTNGQSTDSLAIVPTASITVAGANVLFNGTIIGTFSGGFGTNPLAFTFNNQASLTRVQLVLNAVGFANSSEAPVTTARNVSVQVTDGVGGTSAVQSKSVNVVSVNDAPVIGSIGAAVTYTENAVRVLVFPSASINDVDTVNFANAVLMITNTNGQSTDSLAIVPTASITVSGANVLFNGTMIGSFTGGVGTTPLVFTFNNQASFTRVQLVLNAVGFLSSSESPNTTARNVSVRVTDGVGGTSALQTKQVNVVSVADNPVIGAIGPAVNYTMNGPRVAVFPTATITDVDTVNFANAVLTVTNTNGQSTDSLAIIPTASITFSSANVLFNGTTIGSFTGGSGTIALVFTFNNQASFARVQLVLNAIGFASSLPAPTTTARTVTARVTDGAGGTSTLQSKLVNINQIPVIGSIGAAATYNRNGPRVLVFPTATITDPNTVNFADAVLTVTNTNGQATDSLAIIPTASITVAGANVLFNGTIIGTFTGGAGSTPLVFTFNDQASFSRVQLVLNTVGFASTLATPSTTPRTISVRVTDGVGGTSALQSKLVNIV